MKYYKVLAVGVFLFLSRISFAFQENSGPKLSELFNEEMRKIQEAYEVNINQLRKEITGTIRYENERLKRENRFLVLKLNSERQKTFKELNEIRTEMQKRQNEFEKWFNQEMDIFKYETNMELQNKNKEVKALKAEVRLLKNALGSLSDTIDRGKRTGHQDVEISQSDFAETNNEQKVTFDNGITDQAIRLVPADSSRNGYQGNKRMLSPVASQTKVAFYARLTNPTTPHLDPNQDIVFNQVVTNIGNGYHANHGLFVAPVSGIYVFSTTLISYFPLPQTGANHAKLVKNGQTVACLEQSDAAGWETSSVTVVVELQKGDDIAVQNNDKYNASFWGDGYSSFSGFLLFENMNDPTLVGK